MTAPLTIARVARRAGVAVDTVRFYERQGLIAEPPRNEAGYRQYPADTVARIRFIRRAKDLGFTLEEIGELLALRGTARGTCAEVRAHAVTKVVRIEENLRDLERMKAALSRLVAACADRGDEQDCPILESLDRDEPDESE